ncbi:patatin-like phospholipase family protein [Duganella sp. Leaf126]|uniref:patatin-like phospholipase family protein n=1 Tax=Duganella sp. Leaf126 TaxID=1736266 RepID=UPI001E304307|nr:patatin-like phospholipase family protein [Duganella sp. Leaf126]
MDSWNSEGSRAVSLGLQGAGTYGAFTWGVLDRLLDEDDLVFDKLSGSSSGAINAVVLADGYAYGGGRRCAGTGPRWARPCRSARCSGRRSITWPATGRLNIRRPTTCWK